MRLTSGWVGYLTRNYTEIKTSMVQRMRALVPELTDNSESNLMIILISMFAGLGEQFHYYIDNVARESFITSCRRYSSMVRLVNVIDYRIKSSIPASTDLTMTFSIPLPSNYTLPIGTIFEDTNGLKFQNAKPYTALAGALTLAVPVEQKTTVTSAVLGTTQGLANEGFIIDATYADNTMNILVGADTGWTLQETLGLSGPLDKHYIIRVTVNRTLYLQFGDGTNGLVPPGSETVTGNYYVTQGDLGNVTNDSITSIVTPLSLPAGVSATVNNDFTAAGGLQIQSIESIRRKAPLSVRTLYRAVTRQDYIDIAIMAPGVNTADLLFDCGKEIDIFISPELGGIAQTPLLNSVTQYIDERRMVTTLVNVRPAGESLINIKLTATARFRIDTAQTTTSITNALLDAYSISKSKVNKAIRRSDIYAIVDNLPEVEFLELDRLSITPYARPTNHTTQLNWDIIILDNSNTQLDWKVEYSGFGFNLYKQGQFVSNLTVGVQYTDPLQLISITIFSGPYLGGQEWDFVTLAVNEDLTVNDYSLPITTSASLDISVIEQRIIN